MKGMSVVIGCGALIVASAYAAEDSPALTLLNQAFARQRAMPGYVEHLFARSPAVPGVVDTLTDMAVERLKQQAADKIQEKVALATSHVPLAGEATDRAVDRLHEQVDESLVPAVLPEREVGKIEHAGKREREVLEGNLGEVVRADGRAAYKLQVRQQVAILQMAAAAGSAQAAVISARSVRTSLQSISGSLAQGNVVGSVMAVITALDQVSALLGNARTSADLVKATVMLEKLSGTWICQADSLPPHNFKIVAVEQLEDESIGDTPTHVFLAHRAAAGKSAAQASADGEAPGGYDLQNRVWVRVSDGLPLRSVLTLPGGNGRRTDYEYPSIAIEIPMPECGS